MKAHPMTTEAVNEAARTFSMSHAIAGGAGIVGAVTLSAVIVMLVKQPRTAREWALALISTVVCSLGLGAWVVLYFGLHHALGSANHTEALFGLFQVGGVMFACGLPGWVLVRIAFNTMAKFQDKSLDDAYDDVRGLLP